MPKGELYIRSKRTIAEGSGTGIIDSDTADKPSWVEDTGWTDAYERYGMSLEDGALSKLMTPAPKKQPSGTSQATADGVAYGGGVIGKTDERTLSLDFHITAPNKTTFLTRYGLLASEVLDCGYFQVRVKYLDKFFHFVYLDCTNFEQYEREFAKFTLSVLEPHPEITDSRTPNIMQ